MAETMTMRARAQTTSKDGELFARSGPGTLAGRYLRRFWQPVYRSEDLVTGKPKPIRIMSEDLTLYRGLSGKTYLVDFRCAHRRTQLSVGWVENETIRCFYHGWRYDGTGQCVEQPAEQHPFCQKIKIKSYPVEEYLGVIFAYMGEESPPPLPRYPGLENVEGVREVEVNYRDCNYFQNIENTLDRVHVGFVHSSLNDRFEGVKTAGTFDGRTDSPVLRAEETAWGIRTHVEHPSGLKFHEYMGMPNVQYVPYAIPYDPLAVSRAFISWKLPVDDNHNVQFLISAVRMNPEVIPDYQARRVKRLLKWAENDHREVAKKILVGKMSLQEVDPETTEIVLLQDDLAQGGQREISDHSAEFLGSSDIPLALIRRLWKRELRALEENRILKQWVFKPDQVSSRN
jgi:5,5'-dehydrodivanillate O-demethylase oxygenase subunit